MASNLPSNRIPHRCCLKCRAFFAKIADYPAQISSQTQSETVGFHDVEGFELSVRAGCHLCILIEIELGHEKIEELHQQLEHDSSFRSRQMEAMVWVTFRGVASNSHVDGPFLRLQEARIRPSFVSKVTLVEFQYIPIVNEREERA